MRGNVLVSTFGVLALSCTSAFATVVMDWTPVGNAGNAADPTTGYGAVNYNYQIGKYEVTNSQYAEFLNAKAATDPLNLYSPAMTSSPLGGINRSGSSGSYSYSVKAGYANLPIHFVSWYDAIRFANWMNNGQGNSDTETGSYTLLGGTTTPSNGNSITRNGTNGIFLSSEDEWYKAAFHQPASAGGDSDNYWLYPTQTNVEPNSDQPPGDPSIQTNVANFFRDDGIVNSYNNGYAVTDSTSVSGSQNYLTDVGAYIDAPSYYGTFDQGGNVFEWNEALIGGSSRGVRGGSWDDPSLGLRADDREYLPPSDEGHYVGIRLVLVPEPASASLLGVLIAIGMARRKRRMSP